MAKIFHDELEPETSAKLTAFIIELYFGNFTTTQAAPEYDIAWSIL